MEKFLDKLIAISSKFAQNRVLNVIQGSFMLLMPITMLGGFAAVHVADQDAVFDDRRIHGGRTLVIVIHRQRGFLA